MSVDQSQSNETVRKARPLKRRNVLERSSRFGPNMTPMVDVTLVILIFFMASATIAGHEWFLSAQLPETEDDTQSSGFALPVPMLHVEMFMRDELVLVRGIGDDPLSIDHFIERIETMDPDQVSSLTMSLRAGDDVPYESVIQINEAASAVNMPIAIR